MARRHALAVLEVLDPERDAGERTEQVGLARESLETVLRKRGADTTLTDGGEVVLALGDTTETPSGGLTGWVVYDAPAERSTDLETS